MLTGILKKQKYDDKKLVKYSVRFTDVTFGEENKNMIPANKVLNI